MAIKPYFSLMSITKMRIGILFGGRSGEHEVSLRSARSVLQAIDREKYSVSLIGITKNGRWIGGENPLAALEDGDEAIEQCPDTCLLYTSPSPRD